MSILNPDHVESEAERVGPEITEWLAGLSRAVTTADSVGRALEAALGALGERLGFRRGVALVVGRRGNLSIAATAGGAGQDVRDRRFTLGAVAPRREVYDADEAGEPFLEAIRGLLDAFPSRLAVPLSRAGRVYGLLLLGEPDDLGADAETFEVVGLVAPTLAYVLEARAAQAELRRANSLLAGKTYQLQSLVEVGRELNLAPNVDDLYHVLCAAVSAHTGADVCLVLERQEDRLEVVCARGLAPAPEDSDQLGCRAFFRHAAAVDRPLSVDELEGLPGYDVLVRWGISHLVPMRHRDRVRGVIGVGGRAGEAPRAGDLDFLAALGAQASIARENLRLRDEALVRQRLEKELSIARRIQRSLLPDRSPRLEGYEIAARMRTCFEVGGDYYDFIDAGPGHVGVAVGDVPGNGTPAALLMATVQATVRALAMGSGMRPAELLNQVNRLVTQATRGENFVTFLYGILDTAGHRFVAANAGHCYPVLVHAGGRIEPLDGSSLVLGITSDAEYDEYCIALEPGDLLVIYTDGLSESHGPTGALFGEVALDGVLAAQQGATARQVVDDLFGHLDRFIGDGPMRDDTTVVVIKRT